MSESLQIDWEGFRRQCANRAKAISIAQETVDDVFGDFDVDEDLWRAVIPPEFWHGELDPEGAKVLSMTDDVKAALREMINDDET